MRYFYCIILCVGLLFNGCKSSNHSQTIDYDYTIAFGSCNKQYETNLLWPSILKHQPSVWIWGGDNIYADTDDMVKLKGEYEKQSLDENYARLTSTAKVLGTWDDHDYGLNDGGLEFYKKSESQDLFLDFMGVSKNDVRRQREGIYHAELITTKKGTIKIIVLDTRYFRSALVPDSGSKRRYKSNPDKNATVLGKTQWQWLSNELHNSKADFNIIVSSIQFLSNEHGFETWGNFPNDVERLNKLVISSEAKGVLLLSGDRHISEFSKLELDGLNYPLIDFTSSGLTHAYSNFTGEPNANRVGDVVYEISFGLLKFDFETHTIHMEMRGENDVKLQELTQTY
jgi:alkaline phosphatase D